MAYVKKSTPTRKILWLVCFTGCSGKSLLMDVLELDLSFGVCRLSLDYHRSFRYLSALDIQSFIQRNGCEPKCFMIDAPRNEEAHHLHEIYSTLEELSNGRVEVSFSGRRLKFRIARNIPIVIFANCAPIVRALSEDRWDIKAIFPVQNDFFLQNARISPIILNGAQNLVTWHNIIETIPMDWNYDHFSDLDQMLFDMYQKHCYLLQSQFSGVTDHNNTLCLGCLRITSLEQTIEINKAPENIKREYQLLFQKKI
jgi:hypothetical protein